MPERHDISHRLELRTENGPLPFRIRRKLTQISIHFCEPIGSDQQPPLGRSMQGEDSAGCSVR